MNLQELFNKFSKEMRADPPTCSLLPLISIEGVLYTYSAFTRGSKEVRDFLESLGLAWWVLNDSRLHFLIDLQEIVKMYPADQWNKHLKELATIWSLEDGTN